MPQTLSKDGQTSVRPAGICTKCHCAMVDSIPSSLDIKDEIDRHVTQPNQKLAAEIAAWAVKAYREKIAKERVDRVAILSFPWDRRVMGPGVSLTVDQILIRKGWHFSHNFVTNEVYMQQTTPSDGRRRFGPAPSY